MKKLFLCILMTCVAGSALYAQSGEPDIVLPKVDITIEDRKTLQTDITDTSGELFADTIDPLIKPEITDAIKIDLEKTLPDRIEKPEKRKPVDALIKFGYGLNNNLAADFSIFVKEFNPLIAVTYSRRSKDNYWVEEENRKNYYSSDKLNADITYNKNFFTLNSNLGYSASSYSLQNESIYTTLDKKVLAADFNPYLKFNNRNDLSLVLQNSFLFNSMNDGSSNDADYRNDFDYLLDADLIYSQVLFNDHYLTMHGGYEFNYLNSVTDGTIEDSERFFFNTVKTGAGYSGLFKDTWTLNTSLDFEGVWKEKEFYWHLLPMLRTGYNFKEYMTCYVEGGGSMIKKTGREWFINNDYSVYPASLVPGYHWYGKTGIKGMFAGYITGFSDLEFSYNDRGTAWKLISKKEKLYTLTEENYFSLLLTSGLTASYRQYVSFTASWAHEFLRETAFDAGDTVTARADFGIPPANLTIYGEFQGKFRRVDSDGDAMSNIYLVNAGLDWNYRERFGIGADFKNIAYFQHYQVKEYYDEPGFEFLVYLKIGF